MNAAGQARDEEDATVEDEEELVAFGGVGCPVSDEMAGSSPGNTEVQTRSWSSAMHRPQADIGAFIPATVSGSIHRTRVHCWSQ
ncbi:hypothetical protein ACIGZJ_09285 [Kitasatospora sp. NPDC052868]|uniref:hypothetical protein n=1 Tax=Kitasatospora sp. NPDC052868 TaxID=3364060 RepID=UPI0037C8397B